MSDSTSQVDRPDRLAVISALGRAHPSLAVRTRRRRRRLGQPRRSGRCRRPRAGNGRPSPRPASRGRTARGRLPAALRSAGSRRGPSGEALSTRAARLRCHAATPRLRARRPAARGSSGSSRATRNRHHRGAPRGRERGRETAGRRNRVAAAQHARGSQRVAAASSSVRSKIMVSNRARPTTAPLCFGTVRFISSRKSTRTSSAA